MYCRPLMVFVLKVLGVYDCVCCKWCIQSYTRKTFNTNTIDGRQYIIYNRHNHIHVKPSTQTSSMVDNTSFTTAVVNDVLSTMDDVCVEGFTCIWLCLL
jgi:hypothetical protein